MSLKQLFLEDTAREIKIIKHLHGKITPEMLDYRPKEGMRSMQELMDYLRDCTLGYTHWYLAQDQDKEQKDKRFKEIKERALAHPDLPTALDDQLVVLTEMLAEVTDEQMLSTQTKDFAGRPITLAAALNHGTFKYLGAYRMQLFLYIKMAGVDTINTWDNWIGIDAPKKKEES